MKKCTIYHTGVYNHGDGVLKDNKIYLLGDDNNLYFAEEMFMAREECEGGLIQFEIEGKYGFADIYTGEIIIDPIWDYAGPFYGGYAHVALGVELEIYEGYYQGIWQSGKHGYINKQGTIIIPLEYDDVKEMAYYKCFEVSKDGKWGVVDNKNKILIPLQWDRLSRSYDDGLIFCASKETYEPCLGTKDELVEDTMKARSILIWNYTLKWGVYNKNFNLIVQPELSEKPIMPMIKDSPRSKNYNYYKKYYVLKTQGKYGVVCNDGRLIANVELSKRQVTEMINNISGRTKKDLYI